MNEIFTLFKAIGRPFKAKMLLEDSDKKTTRIGLKVDQEQLTVLPIEYGARATEGASNIEAKDEVEFSPRVKIDVVNALHELGRDIEINPNKLSWLRDEYYREDWREDSNAEQYQELDSNGTIRAAIKATLLDVTVDTEWGIIRDALNMIELEDIDMSLAIVSLSDLNKLGVFEEFCLAVGHYSIYKSRIYGKLKTKIWVPMYLDHNYIARNCYRDEAVMASNRLRQWYENNEDTLSLAQQLTFEQIPVLEWSATGAELRQVRNALLKQLRPMVSNEWATSVSGTNITSAALEDLEVIVQESINDILGAERIGLEINDSMKLNPITDAEFNEHVFLQGLEFIKWKSFDPVKMKWSNDKKAKEQQDLIDELN